jgi:hypothetical protein
MFPNLGRIWIPCQLCTILRQVFELVFPNLDRIWIHVASTLDIYRASLPLHPFLSESRLTSRVQDLMYSINKII